VVGYTEVKILVIISTIDQVASYLSIDSDNLDLPSFEDNIQLFFYGATAGLVVLAFFVDLSVK